MVPFLVSSFLVSISLGHVPGNMCYVERLLFGVVYARRKIKFIRRIRIGLCSTIYWAIYDSQNPFAMYSEAFVNGHSL